MGKLVLYITGACIMALVLVLMTFFIGLSGSVILAPPEERGSLAVGGRGYFIGLLLYCIFVWFLQKRFIQTFPRILRHALFIILPVVVFVFCLEQFWLETLVMLVGIAAVPLYQMLVVLKAARLSRE